MDGTHEFVITFPVYVLLLKDGSGAIMHRNMKNGAIYLVVFTDADAAQSFLERSEIKECLVQKLPTRKELAEFLRQPPSRTGGPTPFNGVLFDPLQSKESGRIPKAAVYSVEQLLKQL
jgi:hypothetical protein